MAAAEFADDPLARFLEWYDAAVRSGAPLPDAMTLATVTTEGRPAARTVLFKGIVNGGIRFFTNYDSRKGRELAHTPYAALVFHWPALGRQIRVEGQVERVSRAESQEYFATRPRESQIGACVSPQSRSIESREALERAFADLDRELGARLPDCPEHWGGYRVIPERIEFWLHRDARLHERTLFERSGDAWRVTLLAP